jgi:hypothetical protein
MDNWYKEAPLHGAPLERKEYEMNPLPSPKNTSNYSEFLAPRRDKRLRTFMVFRINKKDSW